MQNIQTLTEETGMLVRLAALAFALAITALIFAREAGSNAAVIGIPLWWIAVPLWLVLLGFLWMSRRTAPKG